MAKATIEHVRTSGLVYDIIRIDDPLSLSKQYAPGVAPDGVVTRISARSYCKTSKRLFAVNADGWRNADGTPGWDKPIGRPMGLQIANGVVYQEWLASENRSHAAIMKSNGRLVLARHGDPITAADWVANGALWSVCQGLAVVLHGEINNVDEALGTGLSARTVLGQKDDGTVIIIVIEGKTGDYGATGTQAGAIAHSLGCTFAYLCDGGGSAQVWWKDTYAVPSSADTGGTNRYPVETGVISFLVADVDHIEEYDSGLISLPLNSGFTNMGGKPYGAVIRHKGPLIREHVRVAGTFPDNTDTKIIADDTLPLRYFLTYDGLARWAALGSGGRPMAVWAGQARSQYVSLRNTGQSLGYVVGSGQWPAPFTDIDITPL